ncbi:alpha-1,2-mannosyltransferase Mnn2p [Diutina catenulata]
MVLSACVAKSRLLGRRARVRHLVLGLVVIATLSVLALFRSAPAFNHQHSAQSAVISLTEKWLRPVTQSFLEKQQLFESKEAEQVSRLIASTSTPSRAQQKFFTRVFDTLAAGRPPVGRLDNYPTKDRIYHARYDTSTDDSPPFDERFLSKFLQLDPQTLAKMKQSHQWVARKLPEVAPPGLFRGDGIVYVAGGKFNWLALLSIKSVRDHGCTLPIEVFIPKTDEFEDELCGTLLPRYGAKCLHMPSMLPQIARDKFEIRGYQYKALAILLSSFENVLLLDSDNIPCRDPSSLFASDPFRSKGLIVWPDFWKRATSPAFYKIAGVAPSLTAVYPKYNEVAGKYEAQNPPSGDWATEVPLHERVGAIPDPTSESGQLMVSKKSHMKPLLLALYYNLYGPDYYYPLFSQGSDGEGDKETFLAASVVLEKPYYQVGKFLDALGFLDDGFVGAGMGQHDPEQDYAFQRGTSDARPQMMFVHANFPKLDPYVLKKERKIFNSGGERVRMYGTGMRVRAGYDFEMVNWGNMRQFLCVDKINLAYYQFVDREKLCRDIEAHIQFLENSAHLLE